MQRLAFNAALFEGSLVAVAIILGWVFGIRPLASLSFSAIDAAIGLGATLPLLGLLAFCLKCPWPEFRRIDEILEERLVPMFRECQLVQLAILAGLAGLGEEMLFRGIVQAGIQSAIGGTHGLWVGLIASAVLFGLLHLITPTYAILAGLIGLYLGGLWLLTGNLLAPIISHAVYDFLALVYMVRMRKPSVESP